LHSPLYAAFMVLPGLHVSQPQDCLPSAPFLSLVNRFYPAISGPAPVRSVPLWAPLAAWLELQVHFLLRAQERAEETRRWARLLTPPAGSAERLGAQRGRSWLPSAERAARRRAQMLTPPVGRVERSEPRAQSLLRAQEGAVEVLRSARLPMQPAGSAERSEAQK
jgi:hypothetical protein